MDWLWHAKGEKKGPVDLDTSFTEDEGFSKTQAVVLDFLTQEDNNGQRLYPPHKHVVWLDNLFTSVKLLTRLRGLSIGGAGIVRTTKTKREEQGDLEGDIKEALTTAGKKKKKVPAEGTFDNFFWPVGLHQVGALKKPPGSTWAHLVANGPLISISTWWMLSVRVEVVNCITHRAYAAEAA